MISNKKTYQSINFALRLLELLTGALSPVEEKSLCILSGILYFLYFSHIFCNSLMHLPMFLLLFARFSAMSHLFSVPFSGTMAGTNTTNSLSGLGGVTSALTNMSAISPTMAAAAVSGGGMNMNSMNSMNSMNGIGSTAAMTSSPSASMDALTQAYSGIQQYAGLSGLLNQGNFHLTSLSVADETWWMVCDAVMLLDVLSCTSLNKPPHHPPPSHHRHSHNSSLLGCYFLPARHLPACQSACPSAGRPRPPAGRPRPPAGGGGWPPTDH